MKKGLKIGLIVGGSILVAGGAWVGLTKAGIIPNWLGIETLCPGNSCIDCQGKNFYEGEVPQINGKECCEGTYRNKKNKNKETINCNKYGTRCHIENEDEKVVHAKPIIYLYPTTKTEVNVKLGTQKNLLHTYPKYNGEKGRNVIAQPNGDLEDIDTGRKFYALYREGKSDNETNFDEGFVVAGKNIIPFLEEKLAILGLNEREAEEFIVYWLPQMEDNKYNLIRFESIEEQDENMPLNIIPKPDTVIRVMMDWKSIDGPIDISEQHLTTPERNGFTVVEWGGSPKN